MELLSAAERQVEAKAGHEEEERRGVKNTKKSLQEQQEKEVHPDNEYLWVWRW